MTPKWTHPTPSLHLWIWIIHLSSHFRKFEVYASQSEIVMSDNNFFCTAFWFEHSKCILETAYISLMSRLWKSVVHPSWLGCFEAHMTETWQLTCLYLLSFSFSLVSSPIHLPFSFTQCSFSWYPSLQPDLFIHLLPHSFIQVFFIHSYIYLSFYLMIHLCIH